MYLVYVGKIKKKKKKNALDQPPHFSFKSAFHFLSGCPDLKNKDRQNTFFMAEFRLLQ